MSTGSAARIGSATVRRSSVNSTTPSRGGCAARKVAVPVTGTKLTAPKLAGCTDSQLSLRYVAFSVGVSALVTRVLASSTSESRSPHTSHA